MEQAWPCNVPLFTPPPSTHPICCPQSQNEFGSLGGSLLLEMEGDLGLGLLPPALAQQHQQHQQRRRQQRPGSGLGSVMPAPLLPGASSAAPALLGRLPSGAFSSLGAQASSMRRCGDSGDSSFLLSPGIGSTPRMPALFKSPAEQRAAGPSQPYGQHPPRRSSLFSPVTFSPPYAASTMAPTLGGGTAVSTAGVGGSSQAATTVQACSTACGGQGSGGRNLVMVQTGRLDSLDKYLGEVSGRRGEAACCCCCLCSDADAAASYSFVLCPTKSALAVLPSIYSSQTHNTPPPPANRCAAQGRR